MKIQELRIGNLIFRKSDMFKSEVHSVWPNSVKLWCNPLALFDEAEVEPIPLSEEILLKCGFEKSLMYSNDLQLTFGQSTIFFNVKSSTVEIGDFVIENFKYLHQIQNLIFSLTGQELNTSGL